jgi:3'-5' exoribonuclease
VLLHYMDNLDAKMQTVRSELARAEAAGRGGDELTDWVRALERPLLNSQAYLAASARNSDGAPMVVESAATVVVHESVTESVTIEQTELTMNNGKVTDESREERNHALPFED